MTRRTRPPTTPPTTPEPVWRDAAPTDEAPGVRRARAVATYFLSRAGGPPPVGVELAVVVVADPTGPVAPDETWMSHRTADGSLGIEGPGVQVLMGELDDVVRHIALQDPNVARTMTTVARAGMATLACVETGGPFDVCRARMISLDRPAGDA